MLRLFTLLCTFMLSTTILADNGLVKMKSPYSVDETLDRFERAVNDKGMTVFARVNHAKGAAGVDLALAPNQLLIFGNPKVGTQLMQSQPTAGIDLPLKVLAWQDGDGQVWLAWNDPAYLAERHAINDRQALVAKMKTALSGLAGAAVK